MFCFIFRLFLGIREVCNRILIEAANEITAKMMVTIYPGKREVLLAICLMEACIGLAQEVVHSCKVWKS